MENDARQISARLFEISLPVLLSLKQEVNPAVKPTRKHPEAKELTFTQLRALLAIQFGKDQVAKLARGFKVAQSAMSKIVDHLLRQGYLHREPLPEDRRQYRLSLTPKAEQLMERIRLKAAQKYVRAVEELSVADRRRMVEGMDVILGVLQRSKSESL